jgi:hypothetical protein
VIIVFSNLVGIYQKINGCRTQILATNFLEMTSEIAQKRKTAWFGILQTIHN